jgi:NAD(P)H-hydrate epimerase
MILLSAAESRELDRLSQTSYGIDSYRLMTRAGEAVASVVAQRWAEALAAGVLVVAGKGNNGGDGFVAARKLREGGAPVNVLLLARTEELKGDAALAYADYVAAGGVVVEGADEGSLASQKPGVVIDAIFGTGLNAEIRGSIRGVIEALNRFEVPIVAIDIASGVNADTGAVMGVAVQAALTVTFGCAKYGHVSYPGAGFCGTLEVADIGFAPEAIDQISPHGRLIERAEAAGLVTPRSTNTHKGTYGHVLGVAGSRGKGGAALLVGRGALRAGAGLVTVAIPECVAAIVAAGQPELMTEPIADHNGHFASEATIARLTDLIPGMNVVVAGPGMGTSDDTRVVLEWLIREGAAPDRPLLIDADGLNVLAPVNPALFKVARGPIVLTPHPGEMARLLSSTTKDVNANRIGAAQRLAKVTGAHVLLKGARSVIVTRTGAVRINSSGNPGMATAGMGDVLGGIVGSLMGQGIEPGDALTLGVYAHGHAADRLAARVGSFGYLAGDLAAELPAAFTEIVG